jgi:glycosyltransferase involved in cell wall biosynthesis
MPSNTELPPRVLIISSDKYPPFRVDVTVLFGKKLAARGLQVDWILQSQEACDNEYQAQWGGGTVFVGRTDLGSSRRHRIRKHLLGLWNDLHVRRRVREKQYDILEVKDKILATLPAMWAAWRGHALFVYWLSFPHPEASLHLARIGEARYPWLYRIRGWTHFKLLYGFVLKRAAHVIVQSEQMKMDLISYGIAAEKMTAVPMGVDLGTFVSIAPAERHENSGPVVCYLGTLAGERKIDFVVRSFAQVVEHFPTATLLLVGDGDRPGDVEQIRSEALRLNILDRLTITGFLRQKDALQLVASADVCVSPFAPTPILNSTSPTKLVEYMALARPVVANNHPEQERVLMESKAGICVPYTEQAFADAIVRILRDPVEAESMGRRGRAYVEQNRDYERIADMVEGLYRQLAARSRQLR